MKFLRMIIIVFLVVTFQSHRALPMDVPIAPPAPPMDEPSTGVEDLSKALKTVHIQLEHLRHALHEAGKKPVAASAISVTGPTVGNTSISAPGPVIGAIPPKVEPKKPDGEISGQLKHDLKKWIEDVGAGYGVNPSEILGLKKEGLDELNYVEILGKNAEWKDIVENLTAAETKHLGESDKKKWEKFLAKIKKDREKAEAKKHEPPVKKPAAKQPSPTISPKVTPVKSSEPTADDIKHAVNQLAGNIDKFITGDEKALERVKIIPVQQLKDKLLEIMASWSPIKVLNLYQQLRLLPNPGEYENFIAQVGYVLTSRKKLALPQISVANTGKIIKILDTIKVCSGSPMMLKSKFTQGVFNIQEGDFSAMNKSDAEIILDAKSVKGIDLKQVAKNLVTAGVLPADHPLHLLIKKLITVHGAKS